jgi:hypothetical protein
MGTSDGRQPASTPEQSPSGAYPTIATALRTGLASSTHPYTIHKLSCVLIEYKCFLHCCQTRQSGGSAPERALHDITQVTGRDL